MISSHFLCFNEKAIFSNAILLLKKGTKSFSCKKNTVHDETLTRKKKQKSDQSMPHTHHCCGFTRPGSFSHSNDTAVRGALGAPMAEFARPAATTTVPAQPECGGQVNRNGWHRKMGCLHWGCLHWVARKLKREKHHSVRKYNTRLVIHNNSKMFIILPDILVAVVHVDAQSALAVHPRV